MRTFRLELRNKQQARLFGFYKSKSQKISIQCLPDQTGHHPLFNQQLIQSKTTLFVITLSQQDDKEPFFQNEEGIRSKLGPSAVEKGPEKSCLMWPFLK